MTLTLHAPAARLRDALRVAESFTDEHPRAVRGSGIRACAVYSFAHDGHTFSAQWTKGGGLVVRYLEQPQKSDLAPAPEPG